MGGGGGEAGEGQGGVWQSLLLVPAWAGRGSTIDGLVIEMCGVILSVCSPEVSITKLRQECSVSQIIDVQANMPKHCSPFPCTMIS